MSLSYTKQKPFDRNSNYSCFEETKAIKTDFLHVTFLFSRNALNLSAATYFHRENFIAVDP